MRCCAVWIAVLFLLGAGEPLSAAPRGGGRAAARRPARGDLAAVRAELRALRERLAGVASSDAQVKDLHLRLVRLAVRLDRVERAAAAPADLDRRISETAGALRTLRQEVERVRLAGLRAVTLARDQARGGSGVRAGYDDGFFVASPQGRYRLVAKGVLRAWFRLGQAAGDASAEPPRAGPLDLASLGVPNGLLMLSGNVFSPALRYHVELDIGGQGFTLWDFWFDYRPCRYFGVTAGQFSVGYSHQQVNDPYDILFAESSAAALLYGVGRDVGLKLHFHQWQDRVFEEVAVFNGGGRNTLENDNLDFLYLVRAGVMPFGTFAATEGDFRSGDRPLRLLFALGYFFVPMPTGRDLDARDGIDNSYVHQAAAEVLLAARGFAFNGEFYYRYEDRGEAVTQLEPAEKRRLHRFGGFAQASYFIRRIGLGVAARYGYAQPVTFWHRKAGAREPGWQSPLGLPDGVGPLPDSVHEVGASLVYRVFRGHLKLIADYRWFYEAGYGLPNGEGRASRQVHLATLLAQARF